MLTTLMQDDTPLVVTRCIEYAARYHGDTEVVSRLPEGGLLRTCYAEVALRSKAFAMALQDAQVKCVIPGGLEAGWARGFPF